MASGDTMTVHSSMHEDDDDDEIAEDGYHGHRFSMSRLSMFTSNSKQSMSDDGNDVDKDMMINMSRLSIKDEWKVDADGEFSDEKNGQKVPTGSEDSDRDMGWFSLPSSPQRRIRRGWRPHDSYKEESKEYASENEMKGPRYRRSRSSELRERWLKRAWETKKNKAIDDEMDSNNARGESECLVTSRPKGGSSSRSMSMSMDMDEIKACRDLGFDLQSECMLEIPSRMSGSTIDIDSDGNSPIGSWRISNAGDDPRDVKARLKVWAQAVALASTSGLNG